jgi:hypothetical protein
MITLQSIKILWGRYRSLEDQTKDPCRSAGAYWEYFKIEDELIELVPKFVEEIDSLKRALLKERFWSLWKLNESDDVSKITEQARHQLKRELPEIDWEFE